MKKKKEDVFNPKKIIIKFKPKIKAKCLTFIKKCKELNNDFIIKKKNLTQIDRKVKNEERFTYKVAQVINFLYYYFYKIFKNKNDILPIKNEKTFSYFLYNIILEIKDICGNKEKYKNLKILLKKISDKFKELIIQDLEYDIHDILFNLLITLYEEEKSFLKINNEIINKDKKDFEEYYKPLGDIKKSIFFKNFVWFEEDQRKCLECDMKHKIYQYFWTYDIDLKKCIHKIVFENKNILTINDCINYLSQPERIYNILCEKCDKKTIKEKRAKIQKVQNVFIIFLKDIEDDNIINKIKKYHIKIQVNEELELKFCENSGILKIKGLIYLDTETNKFISYFSDQNDLRWYRYKNNKIQTFELKDFIESYDFRTFPYALLYSLEN